MTQRFLLLLSVAGILGGCLSSGSDDGGISSGGGNPPPGGNNPPSISGTPASQVAVGCDFVFAPVASDADGDRLAFSISNPPPWASFDATSGRLSGSPEAGDVGMYSDIRISVSDGTDTAMLGGFSVEVIAAGTGSGSVTLNWTAPMLNEDGTDLTDLVGYVIYYGVQSGQYTEEIPINNPTVTTYVVEGLAPGTYYFVATAKNADDIESRYSGEAVKQVASN